MFFFFHRESHLTCQHCLAQQVTRDVAYQWVGHLVTPHWWEGSDMNKALGSFIAFSAELKVRSHLSIAWKILTAYAENPLKIYVIFCRLITQRPAAHGCGLWTIPCITNLEKEPNTHKLPFWSTAIGPQAVSQICFILFLQTCYILTYLFHELAEPWGWDKLLINSLLSKLVLQMINLVTELTSERVLRYSHYLPPTYLFLKQIFIFYF